MRNELLVRARSLDSPSRKALSDFAQKRELMSVRCTEELFKRKDLIKLIGTGNEAMARDNNHNFSLFMESLFGDYNSEVFLETILWVFRAYRSHGFRTTYWAANLPLWMSILEENLPPESYSEIKPFYDWILVNIPVFAKLSAEEMTETDDYSHHG